MCLLRRVKTEALAHGLRMEVRVRPTRSMRTLALLWFRSSMIYVRSLISFILMIPRF